MYLNLKRFSTYPDFDKHKKEIVDRTGKIENLIFPAF